jgi:hypothetical protein
VIDQVGANEARSTGHGDRPVSPVVLVLSHATVSLVVWDRD